MTDSKIGQIVDGRYLLRRLIAAGAMGSVYEARHTFTGRPVALKILHPGSPVALRERLLREIRVLGAVRHPGVVEVLDAGAFGGEPYLAMEMLEGRTLEGILTSRRRLSLHDAVRVARDLCEALAFAHICGVIHRDVKPGNVMVARTEYGEEVVKLVDFGIAALEDSPRAVESGRLTKAGELLGTPEYMSPEQLMAHDDIDARSDIYAVGVTLFECISGAVPFAGTYPEVLLKVATSPGPPSLRASIPELPSRLSDAIQKALSKDPNERFPSAAAFGAALAEASGDMATQPRGTLLLGPSVPLSGRSSSAAVAPPHTASAGSVVRNETRRRFPRAPYVTPVRIHCANGSTLDGRSEDISVGGMLVVTPRPCEDQERVTVRFASPTSGEIVDVPAVARWVRTARDGKGAVGLEFVDIDEGLKESIARYTAAVPGPKDVQH